MYFLITFALWNRYPVALGAMAFGLTASSLLVEEEKEHKTKKLIQAGVRNEGLPDYRYRAVKSYYYSL